MMTINPFNNQATGKMGETLAVSYLELTGYQLLERNWRHGRVEIDLIACKAGTLHFIEVKLAGACGMVGRKSTSSQKRLSE